MEKRYTALRIIGTLYKVIGVLIAIGAVLLVILTLFSGQMVEGMMQPNAKGLATMVQIMGIVGILIGGAIGALSMYALGEGLYLLINLEENTRYTSMLLRSAYPPAQAPTPVYQQTPQYPPQQYPPQPPSTI